MYLLKGLENSKLVVLNINFVRLSFMWPNLMVFSVSIFVITQDLWGNKISQNGRSWFSFRFAFRFVFGFCFCCFSLFMSPQCSRKYIYIYMSNKLRAGKRRLGMFSLNIWRAYPNRGSPIEITFIFRAVNHMWVCVCGSMSVSIYVCEFEHMRYVGGTVDECFGGYSLRLSLCDYIRII